MPKTRIITENQSVWGIIKGHDTLTANDLASDLECTTQTANYWLNKFVQKGYLQKVRVGREFCYAVSPRGKVVLGDSAVSDNMRPNVELACQHDIIAEIPAGDGFVYYECEACGQISDDGAWWPKM